MPNIDPSQLKKMMDRMGIKSNEIPASKVTIETSDTNIIIDNPQVIMIEAQGTQSFQISGNIHQEEKNVTIEITPDDIDTVKQQTGITDDEAVRKALEESNGDIAQAILKLKESQ